MSVFMKDHRLEIPSIGIIHTTYRDIANMPIQPVGAQGCEGVVELYEVYAPGLTDVEGFSHVMLIYQFHKIEGYELVVTPFMDDKPHGIFATRSPKRPARVGLSIVKVLKVEGNKLCFDGADMLDGSPLIDIKPFFRQSDNRLDARSGWLDEKDATTVETTRSDDRFA